MSTKSTETEHSPLIQKIDEVLPGIDPIAAVVIVFFSVVISFAILFFASIAHPNMPPYFIAIGLVSSSIPITIIAIIQERTIIHPSVCQALVKVASKSELPLLKQFIEDNKGYPRASSLRKLNDQLIKKALDDKENAALKKLGISHS